MKKYRLRLDEYTISAKDSCMFTTLKEAQLAFLRQGVWGKVMLVQAYNFGVALNPDVKPDEDIASIVIKFLWICYLENGDVAYIPLFYEDNDLKDIEYDMLEPVISTTFIYRNQRLYVISVDTKKRINVRQLTLYYCQELIEILLNQQNIEPEQISLKRLFNKFNGQEVGISWVILHDEKDKDGKLVKKVMYMLVNLLEGQKLYSMNLDDLEEYPIDVGDSVEISGVLYNLEKTAGGKYVLAKQNLQILGKKVTQARQYKELCSKVVFTDPEEETGVKLVPKYDKPKNKEKGKAVIVSLKKDED